MTLLYLKLKVKLQNLYNYIFNHQNYVRSKTAHQLNKKLERALINKMHTKIKLKKQIADFMTQEYKLELSEHIPFSRRETIIKSVYHKFGVEMRRNRLYLTNDLHFKS
jgi:hypothetical protein